MNPTTLIKWLSRFAIAWSLVWISFSLGCIARNEGAAVHWHVVMIMGHSVLLVINTRTLLKQRIEGEFPQ